MPYGIQVFDQVTAQVLFDSNTQLGRIIGTVLVKAGESGSITNAAFSTGIPFAVTSAKFVLADPFALGVGISNPVITFSGNTMSWGATSGFFENQPEFTIFYGMHC